MDNPRIIGVGGTNGSGKDTLANILVDDYGWLFVSVSTDLIIPELKRRGLPLEREQMAALSAEWNRTIAKGAIIDKAVEKFQEETKAKTYSGLVISSIRHPWEADRIHELGGQLVWVDADPKLRYQRIFSRRQGDKDQKTFEQFLAEEQAEMFHKGDKATLATAEVKARADIFINNESNDVDVFKKLVKQKLDL
jgi:dephospho-CoA kinase